MCCSAEYDVSGSLGQSKMLYIPEEVIAAGKGVCSGYASLCLKMCRSETSIPLSVHPTLAPPSSSRRAVGGSSSGGRAGWVVTASC